MLILLPPSEGKTAPGRGRPLDPARWPAPLADARAGVLDALVALCAHDPAGAAAVLKVGSTQAADVARNARLHTEPTAPAERVYSGVVYEHLAAATMDAATHRRALARVAVVSGLLGLVRLGERIPAYRLGGGVRLPGIGSLPRFWAPRLAPVIDPAARRGLVVDLRSTTYAGFWQAPPDLAAHVATVRVLHERAGVRTVVSHFNKATKGRLTRALLEDGRDVRTPTALADLLADLGWHVETGEATRSGVPLDVVVDEL